MHSFKKLAVVGLAALMVLGVVPAASADTESVFTDEASGFTYNLIDDGVNPRATVGAYSMADGPETLSIPATVNFEGTDYDVTAIAAYAFNAPMLKSVVIPSGVTSIGDYAFFVGALTSVTIPGSVTSIGDYAFANNDLATVTIPGSVTSIGNHAFEDNELASVVISDGVTSIGDYAFQFDHLTSVTIPASVTSIGEGAFQLQYTGTDMASAQFLGEAPTMGQNALGPFMRLVSYFARYSAGYGSPWTPAGTSDSYPTQALAQVTYDTAGGSTAPAQATVTVGDSVTAPADPTRVGHTFTGWFTGGTKWDFTSPVNADTTLYAEWVVDGPVSTVDSDGIWYAADSGSVAAGATVTRYTGGSTSVSIPATVTIDGTAYAVTAIGDGAFTSHSLTSVVIPDGVTSIGISAFSDNSELTSVNIPYGVTSIGETAFYGTNLGSVTIPNSVTSIGNGAFEGANLGSLVIPGSVTSIGNSAFLHAGLTSLIISDGVTSIAGDSVFRENALTSVTFPDSLTSIGEAAFQSNNLTSVVIPDSLTSIGEAAFAYNNLTSVVIPDSVTSIGYSAFAFNALTSVVIPDSVTSLAGFVFSDNQLTSVAIPNSLTSIGEAAFQNNNLVSVTIPNSVTNIGDSAFGSNKLTSVVIPNSVTSIGEAAFVQNALTAVVIPNSVTSIGNTAFALNALTSVVIPGSVTSIGDYTFAYNNLTSVTIQNGVVSIGANAFRDDWLNSVTIPASVTSVGDAAFDGNGLMLVQFLGAAPTTVGLAAFGPSDWLLLSFLPQYGVSAVAGGFTFPTWTPDGTSDVYNTYALAQVTYDTTGGSTAPATANVNSDGTAPRPADPTRAGYTFTGWSTTGGSLWNFTNRVGADTTLYALWNVSTVVSFTDPDGISYSADSGDVDAGATITGYTGASKDVSIPATVTINGVEFNVTSIGDDAFYGSHLTSVVIPDSVTSIGIGAFYANGLTSVSIPDGVTSIGDYAFANNFLTSASIPDSVTSIGDYAFLQNNLTSVVIPAGVTSIGVSAFDENELLSAQFLGAAPTTVGGGAFGTNDGLLVSYLSQYGSSVVAGGFTFPTWIPDGTADVYATFARATATFDTTGGSTSTPVSVNSDGTLTRPTDPSWAGHAFAGWFTAFTGGTAWDFTSRVGADTTLFAQWTTVTPPVTDPPVTDPPVLIPPLIAPSAPAVTLTVDLAIGSAVANAPVDVSGAGLLANSPWTLVLHSTPTVVASGMTSSTGAFGGTFSLPTSIPAGAHTLTLNGTAPNGSAVNKVVYLTVTDSGTLEYLSAQGPQVLAATGVDTPIDGLIGWALFMLILGTALIVVRRRRTMVR